MDCGLSPLWGFGFLGVLYRRFTPVAINLASLRDFLLSRRLRFGLLIVALSELMEENSVGKQVTHPCMLIGMGVCWGSAQKLNLIGIKR